jgi:hypothetical protein
MSLGFSILLGLIVTAALSAFAMPRAALLRLDGDIGYDPEVSEIEIPDVQPFTFGSAPILTPSDQPRHTNRRAPRTSRSRAQSSAPVHETLSVAPEDPVPQPQIHATTPPAPAPEPAQSLAQTDAIDEVVTEVAPRLSLWQRVHARFFSSPAITEGEDQHESVQTSAPRATSEDEPLASPPVHDSLQPEPLVSDTALPSPRKSWLMRIFSLFPARSHAANTASEMPHTESNAVVLPFGVDDIPSRSSTPVKDIARAAETPSAGTQAAVTSATDAAEMVAQATQTQPEPHAPSMNAEDLLVNALRPRARRMPSETSTETNAQNSAAPEPAHQADVIPFPQAHLYEWMKAVGISRPLDLERRRRLMRAQGAMRSERAQRILTQIVQEDPQLADEATALLERQTVASL